MLQVHAELANLALMRLNFTRPDATYGSISISPQHTVYVLPPAAPSNVGNMLHMGLGEMIPARDVTVGRKVAMSINNTDGDTRFFAVDVTAVERYIGDGWFNPVLQSPFIIADGVVMPLWIPSTALLLDQTIQGKVVDEGIQRNVLAQICTAPLWMEHVQPVGTPGRLGQWDGAHIWPALNELAVIIRSNNMQGKRLNMSAMHEWAMLKYSNWQADSNMVLTSSEIWSKISASFVQVAGNHSLTSADVVPPQMACMSPDAAGQCPLDPTLAV